MSSDYYGDVAGGLADDDYDHEDDGDWRDYDEDDREPDPEDADIARSYAEYYDHCEAKHGGGECDCRPSRLLLLRQKVTDKAERLYWNARVKATTPLWQPVTVRIGPAEITLRLRPDRRCHCSGRGWFYSKTGEPDLRPEGYDGVALCGCGAAIAKLADERRLVRQVQNEPPF